MHPLPKSTLLHDEFGKQEMTQFLAGKLNSPSQVFAAS
jgi:hypothetical protein